MAVSLKIKRGTRAQLNAAAAAGGLKAGEPYLITDENRIAIGLSTTGYETFAKPTAAEGITGGWTFYAQPNLISLAIGGVQVISTTGRYTSLYNAMSMSQDGGVTQGSFVARASGSGDANLAGMSFWNDAYAIKIGVRADGYFGIGGWSRPAWSWYSDPSGNMVAAGNVTAYSDPRLKENVTRIEDPLGLVSALDGVTFRWRDGFAHTAVKAGNRDYGVLSDQVEAVMPEIVTTSIEIDGAHYKTVAYEKLVPVLIEAVKALERRVRDLEASREGAA